MNSNGRLILIMCLSLGLGSCTENEIPLPDQESELLFLGAKNELIIWTESEQELDTVICLPEELIVRDINFESKDVITYTTRSHTEYMAISHENGDTSRCPCPEGFLDDPMAADRYVIKGIVSSDRFDQVETHTDTVFAVSRNGASSWLYKLIRLEAHDDKRVDIYTQEFNQSGKLVAKTDSTYTCEYIDNNRRGFPCRNRFSERLYSESETVNGVCYFTREGKLYKREKEEEEVFIDFKYQFNSKFGNGFHHPTINYNGTKMVVTFARDQLYNEWGTGPIKLYEIDLATKDTTAISSEAHYNPTYSPNSKFVATSCMQGFIIDVTYNVQVYDTEKGEFIDLGEGKRADWLGKDHKFH